MASLAGYAKDKGVKYFLIAFVDLFGTMRAKIVPATAIDMIAKSGAGFAGFATWLDMTPAHPDMLVMPEADTAHPAALEARGGVGDGRSRHGRQAGGAEPAPGAEARRRGRRQGRLRDEDRRRVRVLPDRARRLGHLGRRRYAGQALLRPAGADAPLRGDQGDLRCHDRARLEPLPERPRGRQRPVRDELGVRHLPAAPPTSTPSSSSWSSRSPRSTGCARPSCRSRSSTSPATAATRTCRCGARPARTCSRTRRARWASSKEAYHFIGGAHAFGRCARRHHQPDRQLLQAHQRAAHASRAPPGRPTRSPTAATTART